MAQSKIQKRTKAYEKIKAEIAELESAPPEFIPKVRLRWLKTQAEHLEYLGVNKK